jgi:hypothetical protein
MVVVKHPFVERFANSGTGNATRCATNQRTEQRASQAAQGDTNRAAYGPDSATESCASQSTDSAAGTSADGADHRADLLGSVKGFYPERLALGTLMGHGTSVSSGLSEIERAAESRLGNSRHSCGVEDNKKPQPTNRINGQPEWGFGEEGWMSRQASPGKYAWSVLAESRHQCSFLNGSMCD